MPEKPAAGGRERGDPEEDEADATDQPGQIAVARARRVARDGALDTADGIAEEREAEDDRACDESGSDQSGRPRDGLEQRRIPAQRRAGHEREDAAGKPRKTRAADPGAKSGERGRRRPGPHSSRRRRSRAPTPRTPPLAFAILTPSSRAVQMQRRT